MKGYVFTITTFIIFLGIIAYYTTFSDVARERTQMVNDQIAAERVWRSWLSSASGLSNIANVSFAKSFGTAEINDTLPAARNISYLMERWQTFTGQYASDPTITSVFQDQYGNAVSLGDNKLSKIMLTPVGVNYSWPNWNKNRSTITVSSSDFSNIDHIELNMRTSSYLDGMPDFIWVPNMTSPQNNTCLPSTTHCLKLNLTFTFSGSVWNSTTSYFDADKVSYLKITFFGSYLANVTVGKLPTLLDVNVSNNVITTNTKIVLNTASFYTNFMARLNVTSPFGQKVAPVGLSVWKSQS